MKVVIIPDLHQPFTSKKLDDVLLYIKDFKPELVIQIGDALDMLCFSSHPKKFQGNYPPAAQEIEEGVDNLKTMWKTIQKYSPKSKCVELVGNHEDRVYKRIMEKLPEIRNVYDPRKLWTFSGVHTVYDPRQAYTFKGISFIHGYRTKLGDHCRYMLKPVVCGHSHRGGVYYLPLHDGEKIFELNAGHLLDTTSSVADYMPQKYMNWTLGFGVIDEHGPRFIHL